MQKQYKLQMFVCRVINSFTLAEVLMCLLITGIIASIIIPTIIYEIEDAHFKVLLKEDFGILSQVTKEIASEQGGTLKNVCKLSDSDCFLSLYKSHLNYVKECGNGYLFVKGCWLYITKYLNGRPLYTHNGCGLILSNGTAINFNWFGGTGILADIKIDVNAAQPPNTVGRDIFAFYIVSNVLIPQGAKSDKYYTGNGAFECNPNLPKNIDGPGIYCTAKYLTN